jgi:hypothetical protein
MHSIHHVIQSCNQQCKASYRRRPPACLAPQILMPVSVSAQCPSHIHRPIVVLRPTGSGTELNSPPPPHSRTHTHTYATLKYLACLDQGLRARSNFPKSGRGAGLSEAKLRKLKYGVIFRSPRLGRHTVTVTDYLAQASQLHATATGAV